MCVISHRDFLELKYIKVLFTDELIDVVIYVFICEFIGRFIYQLCCLMSMRIKRDNLSQKILEIIEKSSEPLETVEIISSVKNSTRVKVLYRLYKLRGESLIQGKQVGSGKGTWIWWKLK